MRAAFTTFVVKQPFPVIMEGDLTATITSIDDKGNITIDVKTEGTATHASDAQLCSYCVARICTAYTEIAKGDVFYIRSVLIAKHVDEPVTQSVH